jgi:hypothetical protein
MLWSSNRGVNLPRSVEPQLARLLILYAIMKASLTAVGLLGSQLLPFDGMRYSTNLVFELQQLPDWLRSFNTWDTQHYLLLAERGYGVNPVSNVFFPLYPFLIRSLAPITGGHSLIAAWLLSNAASLLVPYFMYKLCRTFLDADQSFRSGMLLMSFPTAFYMSAAYAEALFLALCLAAFYYLFVKDVLRSTICCALLPLVRAQGLLFIVPIGVLFLETALRTEERGRRGALIQALREYGPPAAGALAGAGAYFIFCRITMGGYLVGLDAHQLNVSDYSLMNLLKPLAWFTRNFADVTLQLHGYTDSALDRAAFILCLPLLVGVALTQRPSLFAYAAVAMLVPALSGNFMSYLRHLLVVFPMFIFLGSRAWRTEYLAVPMFALQVLLYLLHTGGYWVA